MDQVITSTIAILFTVGLLYFIDVIVKKKDMHITDVIKFRYILSFAIGLGAGFGIMKNADSGNPYRIGLSFVLAFVLGTLFGVILHDFFVTLEKRVENKIIFKVKRDPKRTRKKKEK